MITRQEAKEQNIKFYYTGKPCLYGHVSKRYVSTKRCYSCERIRAARTTLDLRTRVLEKFGSACNHCGFTDIRALQIDHVDGGGAAERKILKKDTLYRAVINDSTNKYQLLCANCNCIKRVDKHESGMSPLSENWKAPPYGA
jgi:hypothetical protein